MKAHFQTKVKRSDAPAAQPSTIINNIQGHNPRVNINSTDNSQNFAVNLGASELLRAVRKELEASTIPDAEARAINEAIGKMETASSQEGFKEGYQKFMVAAASHVTVFAPFLPALAGFL
jgi:hypothetical protein